MAPVATYNEIGADLETKWMDAHGSPASEGAVAASPVDVKVLIIDFAGGCMMDLPPVPALGCGLFAGLCLVLLSLGGGSAVGKHAAAAPLDLAALGTNIGMKTHGRGIAVRPPQNGQARWHAARVL